MYRICHHSVFREAYNGLSLFLTEFPHMDESQKEQIKQLIETYSRPNNNPRKERRPALLCKVTQDGYIFIAPKFVKQV